MPTAFPAKQQTRLIHLWKAAFRVKYIEYIATQCLDEFIAICQFYFIFKNLGLCLMLSETQGPGARGMYSHVTWRISRFAEFAKRAGLAAERQKRLAGLVVIRRIILIDRSVNAATPLVRISKYGPHLGYPYGHQNQSVEFFVFSKYIKYNGRVRGGTF